MTGSLHFANIEEQDSLVTPDKPDGMNYVCIVENSKLRGLVQGDDQKINPQQRGACTCPLALPVQMKPL
jgi:hypothetical protein